LIENYLIPIKLGSHTTVMGLRNNTLRA